VKPDISFCIPTLDRLESLKQCLESMNKSKGLFTYEIVIADGGSTDGTVEYLKENKIDFIPNAKGSVHAINLCLHKASSDLLINLNDDMDIVPSTFKKCIELLKKDKSLGLIAPKMIEKLYDNYPNVQVDKKGFVLSKIYIVRKPVLEQIGFNDEHFKTYLIDLDMHLNFLYNGYHTCVSRDIGVIHNRCEKNREFYPESYDKKLENGQIDYFNNKWKMFVDQRRNLFFYFKKCLHCRLLHFLMRNKNKYYIALYDFCLDRCSKFRYKRMDKDFYLFQCNEMKKW